MRELFPNSTKASTITAGLSQRSLFIKVSDINFSLITGSAAGNAYGTLPNIFISPKNEVDLSNIAR